MRIRTIRAIRTYKAEGNKLVPCGGFKAGKFLHVRLKHPEFFENALKPAVQVVGLKGHSEKVYILAHPLNFIPAPAPRHQNADGQNTDCEGSAFNKIKYISAAATPQPIALDYPTAVMFFESNEGDSNSEFPADFNADGKECADGLKDDQYLCVDADGFATMDEIRAMSKKERKAYKKALRLSQHQSKVQGKQGDAALNKALAGAVADKGDSATDAGGAAKSGAAIGGISPMVLIGGGVVAVLVLGTIVFFAMSGTKKPAGAGAAPAAAPAAK